MNIILRVEDYKDNERCATSYVIPLEAFQDIEAMSLKTIIQDMVVKIQQELDND